MDADEGFAPHRAVMFSTHFPHPGVPPAQVLATARLFGLIAGEALARSTGSGAIDELDRVLGTIRSAVLELHS